MRGVKMPEVTTPLRAQLRQECRDGATWSCSSTMTPQRAARALRFGMCARMRQPGIRGLQRRPRVGRSQCVTTASPSTIGFLRLEIRGPGPPPCLLDLARHLTFHYLSWHAAATRACLCLDPVIFDTYLEAKTSPILKSSESGRGVSLMTDKTNTSTILKSSESGRAFPL